MGYGQNNQNQERQAFSLLELNNRVKGVILNAFPGRRAGCVPR